jgi:hypothetical protein
MPKPIEYTKSEGRKYVPVTSRYVSASIILYEGKLAFPIYKNKQVRLSPNDQHYEITQDMEYRPDKVSNMFFGAPDFWWRIMEANGMKDILEFREGKNIILPGSSLLI